MNGVLLMVVAAAVLACGYLGYGRWLANKWGVDKEALTPAKRMKDGKSFSPVSAFVLASVQLDLRCWPCYGYDCRHGLRLAARRALDPRRRHLLWRRSRLWRPVRFDEEQRQVLGSAHREVHRQDRPSPVPAVLLAVLHHRHRRFYRHGLQNVHVHPGR